MRFAKLIIAFLAFMLLLPVTSLAQDVASVTGIVTDNTGGAVADVQVKIVNTRTGAAQMTKTNNEGVYQFTKLQPGPGYELTFTKEGFRAFVASDVYLGVGTTHTLNASLELGAISEIVEVKSQGEATLNTTDASIGNVIETRRIQELPIAIRTNPARLLGLEPGVVANSGGGANRDGAVTGARTDQGNVTLDGIDVNDQTGGFAFTTVGQAPIDSIQEFRTVSANPLADQGRSSGGQVQMVTKSGTNDWHGSARYFNRNDKFAANSFFNNKAGTPKPKLHRNQFGGNFGGHIIKNRLFFFSDYEGRRDSRQFSNARTVPLAHVFEGRVAYINNGPGCNAQSNLATAPSCITIVPASQIASFDPKGIGASPALTSFVKGRYPIGQLGLGLGNQVNTGGVRFNSPVTLADNIWTNRIDFKTGKHQLFGRFNLERFQQDRTDGPIQQFPGDAKTTNSQSHDWSFAIGHTWTLNPSMINQAIFGVTKQVFAFNRTFRPSFPNSFTFGAGLSNPFTSLSSQGRDVPVPTIRDDFSYLHGKHIWQVGVSIKPIQQKSQLTNDFNFLSVGLGGNTNNLDPSLRPTDILNSPTARGQWDGMFTFILGRLATASAQANYSTAGTPFPAGTGKKRNFKYNEYEAYFEDTWRARSELSINYGLRWQYYGVPYEANGFQAINDTDFGNLFAIRSKNALNGISGPAAEPFLRYDLGGKANNARGYYEPTLNNWAPRFSVAYNPSFRSGLPGRLFGERKTVVRFGGGVTYDRVAGAISFIQDQVSYLFDNNQSRKFGGGSARSALTNDPRFTGITTIPPGVVPPLPNISRPFTPFVSGGVPTGNATGEFNFAVDQHFRTPYSYNYALSIQRELPGNFLAEVAYVGRMGRKLFAQADASQILDFKDAASGQLMLSAFNALQQQVIAGGAVTAQAWFENQVGSALLASAGVPCTSPAFVGPGRTPYANCTELVGRPGGGSSVPAGIFRDLVQVGDTATAVSAMYGNAFLFPNVGMSGQFNTNIYNGSFASSSYNGLLVSLRKRVSHNLQFDFNYTFSHSLDNQSSVVNTVAGGLICDLRNFRVCRGNSDFDATHIINSNWVYELPVGRGQLLGRNAPGWLNHIIGGWEVTGIYSWRTGFAFSNTTGSNPIGANFNSPAVLIGSPSALNGNIHTVGTGRSANVQFFGDSAAALAALRNPLHGEIGNRNIMRGPHFSNVDLAVLKYFRMPWSETHRLWLRWEMYNAFNHPSFLEPNANINSGSFGQISGERSSPREMQFALRYDF